MRGCLPGALVVLLAAGAVPATPALEHVQLPPGFSIAVYADDVPNARQMALGDGGTLFVGSRAAGNVYAVRVGEDGRRHSSLIASGLRMPSGIAFRRGALYVAAVDRMLRYDNTESSVASPPQPVEIAKLPAESHHGWRYLGFGPDGGLYVPIGAPCNVCDRGWDGFGVILRMNPDGSGREVIAHGVRNSVGFAWHPRTRELWFTDNGRDLLGDELPADELNRLSRPGQHFGFPFCHAGENVDPEFGQLGRCADATPPVQKLGPHVAALGVKFYTGGMFPARYRGQVLIAEHGSWNRSTPIGYRVTLVRLEGNKAVGYEPFATGRLGGDGKASGRPADLLVLPDGSLLVSDDQNGAIYRITYSAARH
jgi:glucose/arabinose dehydrogenase